MTKIALLIWALNITVDTVGHMSFKYAAIVEHQTELGRWKSMLSSFPIWLGMACFVCEFVLWLAFLSIMPLSLGILIGSINMVTIMFAGRILFKRAPGPHAHHRHDFHLRRRGAGRRFFMKRAFS